MTSIEVRPAEPDEAWDDVVRAAGGMVFASAGFLRLIGSQLEAARAAHLGAFRDGALVGAMPGFVRCDAELGCVSNSSPFYGSHGGVYAKPASEERAACLEALLAAYRDRCAADCVLSNVVEPLGNPDGGLYEAVLRPWRVDDRLGQIVDQLEPSDDAMLTRYHQKTRNMVRKARREGLTVRTATSAAALDFVSRVHAENMAAIGGKAKPPEFFRAVPEHLDAGRSWLVYEALLDGTPTAALLVLFFGDTADYFTPVISAEHRSRQPMSLLVHAAMLDAAQRGLRRFNFGGTWPSQEGVRRFKSRWGSSDVPYRYYVSRYADADHPLFGADAGALLQAFDGFYLFPFEA